MSRSIEIYDKHYFILAVYCGEFEMESSKEIIDRILQACPDTYRSPALLDCTHMTGKISMLDRFNTAVYGQKIKSKVSRMAVVGPQGVFHSDTFFEMVARNRGLNLRVFTNMDEAVEWLKG